MFVKNVDIISSQSLMKVFNDDYCHIDENHSLNFASHKSRLLRLINKGIYMTFFPVGICIFQRAENAITVKLGLKVIISVLQSIDILYKNPLIVQSSFA